MKGWKQLQLGLEDYEIEQLMSIVDTDGDGTLDQEEFIAALGHEMKFSHQQKRDIINMKIK